MSKKVNKESLITHKNQAIKKLSAYIDTLISDEDIRADKLSYWLEDYAQFLSYEASFVSKKLIRYKRGSVIKVNLGYNIGSEEGGLHYAVVVDKNNAMSNPVVTVVPLTSVKPTTDPSNLKHGNVYLGNDLYNLLSHKAHTLSDFIKNSLEKLELQKISYNDKEAKTNIDSEIAFIHTQMNRLNQIIKEINTMKQGSIALINQVTTVSKIRIYNPRSNKDVLSNIILSSDRLEAIDNAIIEKFIGKFDNK